MDKYTFDKKMKEYEDFNPRILKSVYWVARLDGRGFSNLTKKMNCKKPFDDDFQKIMGKVINHLMLKSGIKILYGYTESDEISLLVNKEDDFFNRRINKILSILSSLASSVFTHNTGGIICSFDARISQLPSMENVVEYFRWRQNDSHRNALNGYCYWTLREKMNYTEATCFLEKMSKSSKHDLLMGNGINYNDVTNWHKRGTGFYFKETTIKGFNPLKKQEEITTRKKLFEDKNLPFGEEYSDFIKKIILGSENVKIL